MRSGGHGGKKMSGFKRALVLLFAAAFLVGTPLSAYVASAEETEPAVTTENGNTGEAQPVPNSDSGQPAEGVTQQEQQTLPAENPVPDPNAVPNTPQDVNNGGDPAGVPAQEPAAAENQNPEESLVPAVDDTGANNGATTPSPSPEPSKEPSNEASTEPSKTETVTVNETDPEKLITVTVESIPQSAVLKAEEITDAAPDYTDVVYNPVKTIAAAEGVKKVVFALKIDLGGAVLTNDVRVTVQGERLSDLPEAAVLYRINEQNTAEKITLDYLSDYNKAEKRLSFNTREFTPFVLVIPETEHDFDDGTVTAEATCVKEGVRTYICKNPGCTGTKTEAIPALGHKWDGGTVTQEASCSKEGVRTYKCTNPGCTETKTESIPKTAHTPVTETTSLAATCEKEGVETTITECSVCGEELKKEEKKIPALGHTPGTPVEENRIEPKAGQPGSYDEVVYCKVCKKEISRKKVEIPALPAEVKNDARSITFNKDGEGGMVSVTAENAPANTNLVISSVSPDVIELVEKSTINKVKYDVWFAVDINMGGTLDQSVNITLQSEKLANLPSGALLYHIDPSRGKVRKTSYTYNKGQRSVTFKSREFSPFMILVKKGENTAAKDIKDAASNSGLEGTGSSVPTYYPAGDNGTGYYGGYNATGFGYGGFNETAMYGGMNNTNVTGFNDTGVAGFNDTGFAGENGTNVTAVTNTTAANTTGAANETAVEKEDASGGGLSTGALIGIIAAVIAAAAVVFGVVRYMKNGRRKE